MKINSLSIIFPFYIESLRINKCFQDIIKFNKLNRSMKIEYVFVDDGSNDDSCKKIINFIKKNKKQINKKYKLVKLIKNTGKGEALKQGVLKSKNNWILTLDVDISVSLTQIISWYKKKLISSNKKIFFGSRNLKNSKTYSKMHRLFIGHFFRLIIKLLFSINLKDTQCGYKLYYNKIAKKIFSKLTEKGFIHDVEITLLAKKYNFEIVELPVIWTHKNNGKINIFLDSIKMFLSLIILRFKIN